MFRNASNNENEAEDRRKSSSSSEGEYHVGSPEFQTPNFSGIPEWNPQGPASLQYMCLLPLSLMHLKYCSSPSEQTPYVNKVKVSVTHRQQRLKEFKLGKTTGRNIYDEKKLQKAASDNQYELVIELLESGIDPCCCDNKQRSALHFAASQGNELIVKVLLDKGANPNCRDILGNTPMHLGFSKMESTNMSFSFSGYGGLNRLPTPERLPEVDPFPSAITGHVPVVTLLLKAGTNVKSVDKNGRTPLNLAQARLKLLSINTSCTSEHLKQEVNQISEMMKTYLNLIDLRHVTTAEVDQLCSRLQRSSTLDEVDAVNSLLSSFTSMSLQKDMQPG